MSEYGITNGFYRVDLNVEDIPKLGWLFPPRQVPSLLCPPLVLPMCWTNSLHTFSTTTETIADLANEHIHSSLEPKAYQLDDEVKATSLPEVDKRPVLPSSPISTPSHSPGTHHCQKIMTHSVTLMYLLMILLV